MLNVRCWTKQTPCCGAVIAGFDPQETLDVHCGDGFDEYRGLAAMSILHAETLRIWTGDTRDTRPNSDISGAE
jgi:hypothetical protein